MMHSCVASYLRNDAQSLPQALQADVPNVLSSDVDVALLGLVEAEQKPNDGALPASGFRNHHHITLRSSPHPHRHLLM